MREGTAQDRNHWWLPLFEYPLTPESLELWYGCICWKYNKATPKVFADVIQDVWIGF